MSKLIRLSSGKHTKVDDKDFEWLSKTKWQCTSDDRVVDIWKVNGKQKRTYMSRMIMNCPDDMVVDHINRDTLDKRRINLRVCTRQENNRNRRFKVKKTSQFIGVHKRKRRCKVSKPWCAYIWHGKHRFIGYYCTEIEAAKARDVVAKELFGEYAPLNFP